MKPSPIPIAPGKLVEQPKVDALVQRLRQQSSDDAHVEAKACARQLGASVWETVSAFANTEGGIILLGLREDSNFQPTPTFPLEKVKDQFVDGMGYANSSGQKLTNPPRFTVERGHVEGHQILIIQIHPNQPGLRPCYITARGPGSGSYQRVDDKDIRLSPTEVHELQQELLPQGSDRLLVDESTAADLDPTITAELLASSRSTRVAVGAANKQEQLFRLSVTDRDANTRRAGLLACGIYPQQFLPRHFIDVTAHPTTTKATPGTDVRFLDRELCEGPLSIMLDRSVKAVLRNLKTRAVVAGVTRTETPEVPEVALREAIANALVHRELHPLFDGQSVTVDIYTDRIEIRSPGGLWGGTTLHNIADGVSRCRNATLMQLLLKLPTHNSLGSSLSGAVEGQGGGLSVMQNKMKTAGLPPAEFVASPDSFTVILRRPNGPAAIPATTQVEHLGPKYADVLSALSHDEPRGLSDIAQATGRSPNALRQVMRQLMQQGLIVATAPPSSRNRKYLLSSRQMD